MTKPGPPFSAGFTDPSVDTSSSSPKLIIFAFFFFPILFVGFSESD